MLNAKLAHPRATFLLCSTVSLIKKDIRRRQRGRFNLGEFGKHSNTHNHTHRQTHVHTHTERPEGVPVKQHVLVQSTTFAGCLPVWQILLAMGLIG